MRFICLLWLARKCTVYSVIIYVFFSTGNAIHFVFNKCNKPLPTYFDIVSAVRNVAIKDDLNVLYKVTLDFFMITLSLVVYLSPLIQFDLKPEDACCV